MIRLCNCFRSAQSLCYTRQTFYQRGIQMKDTAKSYLRWLSEETATDWWNDSAEPSELETAIAHGATGTTTNPVLVARTLRANPAISARQAEDIGVDPSATSPTEIRTCYVVTAAARMFERIHETTEGNLGYACAQVDPAIAARADAMMDMARRFHAWAPNIAVKLPVTLAGLDALEECAAEGITITATVSFTVPQVIAVAERYRKGSVRARQAGRDPGKCFAVIMMGRLDDYLWDVAVEQKAGVQESDVRQAGLAVVKRAYAIFRGRDYEARLLPAALRGAHHVQELAGADVLMSVPPRVQEELLRPDVARELHADQPVAPDITERLMAMPEFVRCYEPDGMAPEHFLTFGLTQRTLTQFDQAGWLRIGA